MVNANCTLLAKVITLQIKPGDSLGSRVCIEYYYNAYKTNCSVMFQDREGIYENALVYFSFFSKVILLRS